MNPLVYHDDGLLFFKVMCWGGPRHLEVATIKSSDSRVWFVVPSRITRVTELIRPEAVYMGKVCYDVENFRWVSPAGDMWWRVAVYPENKDTQKRQLEVAANFILWLASPSRFAALETESKNQNETET